MLILVVQSFLTRRFLKISTVFFIIFFVANRAIAIDSIHSPQFTRDIPSAGVIIQKKINTNFSKVVEIDRSSGVNVFKKVFPSVVKIVTNTSEGTGVVISSKSQLILTNYHVVESNIDVGVIFPNDSGQNRLTMARVIKIDEIKDLALLKLNKERSDLIPLKLSSENPEVGADVHAIGHPLGEDWTYTRGYISQVRRNYSWKTDVSAHYVADVIQTQTPINPGNSGGPLVNEKAEMIGINTFSNSTAQGLNYSVAMTSIQDFFASKDDNLRVALPKKSNQFGNMLGSEDQNKNGNPDFYMFDFNSNKQADTYVLDEDENLIAETVLLDHNENGVIETRIDFKKYDGTDVAVYRFDDDEDNVFDTFGLDADLDGHLDHVEAIN